MSKRKSSSSQTMEILTILVLLIVIVMNGYEVYKESSETYVEPRCIRGCSRDTDCCTGGKCMKAPKAASGQCAYT